MRLESQKPHRRYNTGYGRRVCKAALFDGAFAGFERQASFKAEERFGLCCVVFGWNRKFLELLLQASLNDEKEWDGNDLNKPPECWIRWALGLIQHGSYVLNSSSA